jgi:hypothetical protein
MVKSDAGLDMDVVVAEKHRLNEVLTKFQAEMFHRLTVKVMAGCTGWDDPANREQIYNALLAHAAGIPLAAGQEADVANFAMFLWYQRVQPTVPLALGARDVAVVQQAAGSDVWPRGVAPGED